MARATYKSKIRKSISYLIDYVKFMVYVISFLSPVWDLRFGLTFAYLDVNNVCKALG